MSEVSEVGEVAGNVVEQTVVKKPRAAVRPIDEKLFGAAVKQANKDGKSAVEFAKAFATQHNVNEQSVLQKYYTFRKGVKEMIEAGGEDVDIELAKKYLAKISLKDGRTGGVGRPKNNPLQTLKNIIGDLD